jgi:hypothetical protein
VAISLAVIWSLLDLYWCMRDLDLDEAAVVEEVLMGCLFVDLAVSLSCRICSRRLFVCWRLLLSSSSEEESSCDRRRFLAFGEDANDAVLWGSSAWLAERSASGFFFGLRNMVVFVGVVGLLWGGAAML